VNKPAIFRVWLKIGFGIVAIVLLFGHLRPTPWKVGTIPLSPIQIFYSILSSAIVLTVCICGCDASPSVGRYFGAERIVNYKEGIYNSSYKLTRTIIFVRLSRRLPLRQIKAVWLSRSATKKAGE